MSQLLFIGNMRMGEIIIIALVILLLFGAKMIPELMRSIGKGIKSFRDGLSEDSPSAEAPQGENKEEKKE